MTYTYTVVLRKEPEGGYTVLVPSLPGCLTCGETVEKALEMAREVIPLFLETLRDTGQPVPRDKPSFRLSMAGTEETLVYKVTVTVELASPEAVAVA